MSFVIRFAILAAIVLGLQQLYNSPAYRSQIDQALKQLQARFSQIEEQVSRQVGYGSVSTLNPKTVAIAIPRTRGADWGPVGTLGSKILGAGASIKVEIDSSGSSGPKESDLSTLTSVLQKTSGKQVSVTSDQTNLPKESNYTLAQVVEMTKNNRSCYTSATQICLYLLFLPGSFEGSNALGASFTSSSVAFFPDQFAKGANPLVSRDRLAQATITHELGHLFGLVSLSYQSARDHEDPDHPGHSRNPGSVMYWAVEDLSLSSVLSGGPPTSFDGDDEADLAQIKAGQ